jgi:protein-S-isoprenylcysteine O-methyltransferase Ste14
MLIIKNIIYTIFIPGTVAVLIPYWLLTRNFTEIPSHWGMLQYLALLLALLGLSFFSRCIWDFATDGSGTPSPFDPPKALVVRGLYRYVRNPLYLSCLLLLLGETTFFGSWSLLRYATGFFVTVHLIVILYEERALRRTFGASYDRYCRNVRRWMPGKKYQETTLPAVAPVTERTGW